VAKESAIQGSNGTISGQISLLEATHHFDAIIFGDIDMGFEYSGILGIIILVLDIWAILQIIKGGGSTGSKLLWILIILLLPVVGLLIWLVAGRGKI